jgi:starch synthase (maltosyl-transferring)
MGMTQKFKIDCLKQVHNFLKSRIDDGKKIDYRIPSLWVGLQKKQNKDIIVNPFLFYKNKIEEVLKYNSPIRNKKADLSGEWSKKSIAYNIFVRLTTAYDHDGNGRIDTVAGDNGWRETGTFLKTIALLPNLKKMGINTLHFLPITSIGQDGNKGSLGSPYAIKNPYKIDENLAEPVLGFDVDFQFKSLIEAAKRMGFRIMLEFVFRTAAKDSDWIPQNPEWFYWIKEDIELRDRTEMDENKYGSPLFSSSHLQEIHRLVNEKKLDSLIEPNPVYQQMFTKIPSNIEKTGEKYIGETDDGTKVKIPGAFADWPPDDNQPPWSDVTYLRMYNHHSFNYIAYNTIRMYDSNFAKYENRNEPLWKKIIEIIPHYQSEFGIDGVMIDMGHALPPELLKAIEKKARKINPCFAFWEENFSLTKKSREQGYNVTLGYLWCDEHHPDKLKNLLRFCSNEGFPLPFFSTSETHNTPRSVTREGGILYSKYSFAINCFLPAIIFVHSGYELGEEYPVNTGLDFPDEEQKKYPSENLPLFSESVYKWNNSQQFIQYMIEILKVRKIYENIITNISPSTIEFIECKNENVICFLRRSMDKKKKIFIIANSNFDRAEKVQITMSNKNMALIDRIKHKKITLGNGRINIKLKPGEVKIFGN